MEPKKLLDLILNSKELKEFGYIKEWYSEWKTIVEKFSGNFLCITKGKEDTESNFFRDTIKISEQDIQLVFNIEYFNVIYKNHPEAFEQYLVNIDGTNLKCSEYEVIYEDFLATEKVLKNDALPIYIIAWPTMKKYVLTLQMEIIESVQRLMKKEKISRYIVQICIWQLWQEPQLMIV